jgi:hypothetical protein
MTARMILLDADPLHLKPSVGEVMKSPTAQAGRQLCTHYAIAAMVLFEPSQANAVHLCRT